MNKHLHHFIKTITEDKLVVVPPLFLTKFSRDVNTLMRQTRQHWPELGTSVQFLCTGLD
uniref:Uncharacterized protein n=1 Tax=Arundo donax TaxID=35708 RepID=A0A0A8Y310_ARUDO